MVDYLRQTDSLIGCNTDIGATFTDLSALRRNATRNKHSQYLKLTL